MGAEDKGGTSENLLSRVSDAATGGAQCAKKSEDIRKRPD
jgi:hypothetical protein